jgi:toxin FitB
VVSWLLDTNVISEWTKPKPSKSVAEFLSSQPKSSLFISLVSLIEVRRGIESLPPSTMKTKLHKWLQGVLRPDFGDRTLPIDEAAIDAVLRLADNAKRKRRQVPLSDALIAATALAHGLTVVTRNVRDFEVFEVPCFNPFTGQRYNGA